MRALKLLTVLLPVSDVPLTELVVSVPVLIQPPPSPRLRPPLDRRCCPTGPH